MIESSTTFEQIDSEALLNVQLGRRRSSTITCDRRPERASHYDGPSRSRCQCVCQPDWRLPPAAVVRARSIVTLNPGRRYELSDRCRKGDDILKPCQGGRMYKIYLDYTVLHREYTAYTSFQYKFVSSLDASRRATSTNRHGFEHLTCPRLENGRASIDNK